MRFCVLFPLLHERGMARIALTAWRRQDLPGGEYQIVLIPLQGAQESTAHLRDLLLPTDRVLPVQARHMTEAFDLGARASTGEYLLFTEAHCEPDIRCLSQLWRFLDNNRRLAGACLRSIPACENSYAEIDARTFEEGYRLYRQDEDWRKVNVHGFALRKAVYDEVGGLACRYGRFAEMILAAKLRDRGHRLGYAEDAAVTHHYRSTLDELLEGIDEYILGESVYRVEHPGPDRIGYSFLPDTGNPFTAQHRALNRAVCRALGFQWLFREGWRTATFGRALCDALLERLGVIVMGSRWHVWWAYLLTKRAQWRCHQRRNDPPRLDPAYRGLIVHGTRLSRLRILAQQAAVAPSVPLIQTHYNILDFPDEHCLGLHNVEWSNGRPFRWTGRCAAFRLAFNGPARAICIDTLNLRRFPAPLELAAFLNGRRLQASENIEGVIQLNIPSDGCRRAGDQFLVLACTPFLPWSVGVSDQRELGLPIASLEILANSQLEIPARSAA